jgi:hypothetical protein
VLAAFAYALDKPVAVATRLLLKTILHHNEFLYKILTRRIQQGMDEQKKRQFRALCRYLDQHSPDHYITLTSLLTTIIEEVCKKEKP